MKSHSPETPPKKNKTVSWRNIVLIGSLGDENIWLMGSLTEVHESPETKVLRQEQNEQVRRILARLPDEDQDLIHWKFGFYGETLTNKAIGKFRGCSKEAIRQKLKRLYRTLHKYIQEENEEEAGRRLLRLKTEDCRLKLSLIHI